MERRGGSSRTVTVTLSLPTVVSGLIMLCAGFVGVFSLGILLGRGHNIEANIPQLERIMPQAAHTEQPKLVVPGEGAPAGQGNAQTAVHGPETAHGSGQNAGQSPPPAAGQKGDAQTATAARAGNAQGAGTPPPPDVRNQTMDQGDLAYRDSLKPQTRTSAQKPGTPKRDTNKSKGEVAAQTKQPPADSAAKTGAFNYVYQVAAYKDAGMSDKLASKLKTAGIKARTEKSLENGTTWYRTVVDFRGKPDDTDGLRAKLKAQGFTRLILKSKVPVR